MKQGRGRIFKKSSFLLSLSKEASTATSACHDFHGLCYTCTVALSNNTIKGFLDLQTNLPHLGAEWLEKPIVD